MSANTATSAGHGGCSDLADLVQQAEQLTAQMDTTSSLGEAAGGDGELPRVERNLRQLLEAGQQLWSRTTAAHPTTGSQQQQVGASILLGSRGVDLPAMTDRLEALHATVAEAPPPPAAPVPHDTDVASFLRAQRENAILEVVESSKKATYDLAERHHWSQLEARWEAEKQRVLGALAASTDTAPGSADLAASLCEQPGGVGGRSRTANAGVASALTAAEMTYAAQMERYVSAILDGGGAAAATVRRPQLASLCVEAAAQLNDPPATELWGVVQSVGDMQMPGGGGGRFSTDVQSALMDRSLKLLEDEHMERARQLVFSNLRGARLGGVPGTRQLMQSYLAVRPVAATLSTDDAAVMCDGVPGWPLVFHCLRCGDRTAARQAAASCRPALLDVAGWLDEAGRSADGRVSVGSQADIRLQYRRAAAAVAAVGGGDVIDSHRRAVLAVLGAGAEALSSDDLADVAATTDDFIWLKLACVRTLPVEARLDALTSLQTRLLVEFGESHFDAYNQPVLYFRVLFLTGQLEAAVEFLSRVEKLRPHALHIGLALQELAVLQISHSRHGALLTHDNTTPPAGPRRRLNLARLTLMYTRRFETSEPQVVLRYLFLLRHLHAAAVTTDGGEGEQPDMITAAVVELILESGDYARLVGSVTADGERRAGAVDAYQLTDGDGRPLAERVAAECERRGLLEDAVQLYDVAGNHDRMLQLLVSLLSQTAAQAPPPPAAAAAGLSQRARLQQAATAIAKRFHERPHNAAQSRVDTLYLLLDVMSFFDLYHAGRRDEALRVIRRLRVVSLSAADLQPRLDDFSRLDDEVRRCTADILLATMSLLQATAAAAGPASSGGGVISPAAACVEAKQQARALLTFAGSVPYRLPGDTHARLTRMESLMG